MVMTITTVDFEIPTSSFRKFGALLLLVDLDDQLDMSSHVYARVYDLEFLHWGVYSFFFFFTSLDTLDTP
jgi:hypothetical protein